MLQLRPTFSESWYRVAKLKARLRPSAQISRQYYRGERWYVVRDPAGNQFHRLSDPAYRFIGLLDGKRSVQEAWDLCGGQLADDAPTQPEVIQILSQLYSANLIESDVSPDATVLLRRHKTMMKRKFQSRLMNVMFPRIPIWDLDQFLCRWMPVVRPFVSKIGAVLWLVAVIGAIAVVAPRWADLKLAAENAIEPGNWMWLWVVFVLIKLIHELGHAFACRRFGGEVHELGIMFLVLVPTPYVDASSAWAFPSRWARMFVGAAGMIIELFFAAILAFVWANTNPESLINKLSYNGMLIASVSTLIFNANPLLRYDGYYILSDFLEIPNLRQKSSEYTMGLIKRHIFRVKANQPLPPPIQRVWLFLYGILSSIYRIFVGVMIILLVAFQVPVLGILMALGGVATWLIVPIFKTTKYLLLDPELHRKRIPATAFVLAVVTGALLLIGKVPFPNRLDAVGALEPSEKFVIYTPVSGFVQDIRARDGQMMRKGEVILIADDPALKLTIRQLHARLKGLEARLTQSTATDPAQRNIDLLEIKAVTEQLTEAQRKKDDLTIRSPGNGQLVAPDLDQFPGRYLQRGQEFATIAGMDQLRIRAAIEQRDAQLADPKDIRETEIRLAGMLDPVLYGRDTQMLPASLNSLPSNVLGHAGGGDIAVDPRDPHGKRTLSSQFELRTTLPNPGWKYLPGQRAYIRLTLAKKPLLDQWTRRIYQLIQVRAATGSKLST